MKSGAIFFCGWVLWQPTMVGDMTIWDPVAGFDTLAACQEAAIRRSLLEVKPSGSEEETEKFVAGQKLSVARTGIYPSGMKCLPEPVDPRPRIYRLK